MFQTFPEEKVKRLLEFLKDYPATCHGSLAEKNPNNLGELLGVYDYATWHCHRDLLLSYNSRLNLL
jgi:hypothetical protein